MRSYCKCFDDKGCRWTAFTVCLSVDNVRPSMMNFSSLRDIRHWVPLLTNTKSRFLKIQFSIRSQRSQASLLHKWLFVGDCKWVTVYCLRAQMRQGSRKILMFLTGLYLKICLPSFLKLSRQVPFSFIYIFESRFDNITMSIKWHKTSYRVKRCYFYFIDKCFDQNVMYKMDSWIISQPFSLFKIRYKRINELFPNKKQGFTFG